MTENQAIILSSCRKCNQEHWFMIGDNEDLCINCAMEAFTEFWEAWEGLRDQNYD